MLFLIASLAMLSAAWGQNNDSACPSLRSLQASQKTLVDTTAQIRDLVAMNNQQLSNESLISLMQLAVSRQLMSDQGNKPATSLNSSTSTCDCNETVATLKQLMAQTKNNEEAIHNLTADNIRLRALAMSNGNAILNLTSANNMLNAQVMDIRAVHNQTTKPGNCGSSSHGWKRVAYLNMSNPSEQCPSGFGLYNENGIRACGKRSRYNSLGRGCKSFQVTTSFYYTEVCGSVIGYQYYSPDGFSTEFSSIDSYYVDGISLTHGTPKRQHIWTFTTTGSQRCPCLGNTGRPFVGNDFFCESGNHGPGPSTSQLYPEPLWDGKGCSSLETACCQAPGLPWFHKKLNAPTNDNMEMRLCADNSDEDIPFSSYEIYIK